MYKKGEMGGSGYEGSGLDRKRNNKKKVGWIEIVVSAQQAEEYEERI